MSITAMHDVGAYLKVVTGHPPENSLAATITGAAIERTIFMSCVLHAACGAATGSPTGQTVDSKLQQSVDGSTSWTDVTGGAIAQLLDTDDIEAYVDVDLGSVENYIRVVTVVGFTAGTDPAIPVQASLVLGGAKELPQA